jgi:hypothetical protein
LGAAEPRYVLQSPGLVENCVGLYVPLLEFNHVGRKDKKGKWQPHWWRKPLKDSRLIDSAQFLIDGPHVAVPKMWIETGNSKLLLELHIFSRPYVHAQDKERDRIVTFTLINRTLPDSDLPRVRCAFSSASSSSRMPTVGTAFLTITARRC